MIPVPLAAAGQPAAAPPVAWALVRLRRDGLPPLRFVGGLIARHDGQAAAARLWHDLALYRVASGDGGGYAVEIVARLATGGTVWPARCHAALAGTLDAAASRLERHDAARDLCPGVSAPALALDDPALSPVALAARAAMLQVARHDILRRYRIGVGAFLADLGRRDCRGP